MPLFVRQRVFFVYIRNQKDIRHRTYGLFCLVNMSLEDLNKFIQRTVIFFEAQMPEHDACIEKNLASELPSVPIDCQNDPYQKGARGGDGNLPSFAS